MISVGCGCTLLKRGWKIKEKTWKEDLECENKSFGKKDIYEVHTKCINKCAKFRHAAAI